MRYTLRSLALGTALGVAGCAHPPLDVAPVLDLADRDCSAAPSVAAALPTVSTIYGDREKPTITLIDNGSPCVSGPNGKALYAVFALPDGGPYTVSLASNPAGRSLFAPRASVLDDSGKPVRDIPTNSFMFRGTAMTALYRSHPGERYLLVESDPPSVGKPLSRVSETVNSYTVSTGYASTTVYLGNDIAMNTTWAHNGQVVVTVISDKPAK